MKRLLEEFIFEADYSEVEKCFKKNKLTQTKVALAAAGKQIQCIAVNRRQYPTLVTAEGHK